MDEHFIKKLMSTLKCGVCGQHYETNNVTIIRHQDKMWFLSIVCPSCHSQALVAAVVKESKQGEIITDLTEVEVAKFTGKEPIKADDALDVHNFLKNFDGDFFKLFGKN